MGWALSWVTSVCEFLEISRHRSVSCGDERRDYSGRHRRKIAALVPGAIWWMYPFDLWPTNLKHISNNVVVLPDAGITALVLAGGRFTHLRKVPVDAVAYENFDYVRPDWTGHLGRSYPIPCIKSPAS